MCLSRLSRSFRLGRCGGIHRIRNHSGNTHDRFPRIHTRFYKCFVFFFFLCIRVGGLFFTFVCVWRCLFTVQIPKQIRESWIIIQQSKEWNNQNMSSLLLTVQVVESVTGIKRFVSTAIEFLTCQLTQVYIIKPSFTQVMV